jgi:immune inhibitor A
LKTNPHPAKYYEVACNRFGSRGAVRRFTDAIGWYPGYEYRPDLNAASPLFRDADASVTGTSPGPATRATGRPPTRRTCRSA